MFRTKPSNAFARPHDLVEIVSPKSIQDLESAPAWVRESILSCPYVVVRRKPLSESGIAIGVRGKSRDQRWPGFIHPDQIKRVISPFQLRISTEVSRERLDAIPALRHLLALQENWCNTNFKWGPGGSVGFELASGYQVATSSSDLDIVLYAPVSFDRDDACSLVSSVREISTSIDVLVETPVCAFSLEEYANSQGCSLLLRCLDEPRLGINPWFIENESGSEAGLFVGLEAPV